MSAFNNTFGVERKAWLFLYMNDNVRQSATRRTYLDCLRIIATFAVMILHIASQNWYAVDVGTREWKVFDFFDSMVRWSVPVFVMISGYLFLGGSKSIEYIFKKNILRIATAFIFWSALYAAINLVSGKIELKNALREFVEGPTHLWFLFMIVGLYILVPLLHKIVETTESTRYFIVISLVFTFVFPYAVKLVSLYLGKIGMVADGILKSVCFYFTLGYVSYFVYGYHLGKIEIGVRVRRFIYLAGILGFAVTAFASFIFPITPESAVLSFHDNMTLNVMLESAAVFVFARYNLDFSSASYRTKEIIKKLSNYSFGAYLVHVMVISQLNRLFGINTLSFNPAIAVPVIGIVTFIISYAISFILHQIPVLKKYVV